MTLKQLIVFIYHIFGKTLLVCICLGFLLELDPVSFHFCHFLGNSLLLWAELISCGKMWIFLTWIHVFHYVLLPSNLQLSWVYFYFISMYFNLRTSRNILKFIFNVIQIFKHSSLLFQFQKMALEMFYIRKNNMHWYIYNSSDRNWGWLIVKQGGIKYHFLFLWYDSTCHNDNNVRLWTWRPGFNPKSGHTKDSKMVLDASFHSTQHYKVLIKDKLSNPGKRQAIKKRAFTTL